MRLVVDEEGVVGKIELVFFFDFRGILEIFVVEKFIMFCFNVCVVFLCEVCEVLVVRI